MAGHRMMFPARVSLALDNASNKFNFSRFSWAAKWLRLTSVPCTYLVSSQLSFTESCCFWRRSLCSSAPLTAKLGPPSEGSGCRGLAGTSTPLSSSSSSSSLSSASSDDGSTELLQLVTVLELLLELEFALMLWLLLLFLLVYGRKTCGSHPSGGSKSSPSSSALLTSSSVTTDTHTKTLDVHASMHYRTPYTETCQYALENHIRWNMPICVT